MEIRTAKTPAEIEAARRLFIAYEKFLNVDLCFQDFDKELATLPGKYAGPDGALLIAIDNGQTAGCVALRKIAEGVCEMKRLYVIPAYRGHGLGRELAERIIQEAIRAGYRSMRLDTLERLKEAMHLYEALGFKRTVPYYRNPLEGVVYLELLLNNSPSVE